jgi:hypothetical protein
MLFDDGICSIVHLSALVAAFLPALELVWECLVAVVHSLHTPELLLFCALICCVGRDFGKG